MHGRICHFKRDGISLQNSHFFTEAPMSRNYCLSELCAEKRMEYVEKFQSDREVSILLATTGICGHGFSLTAASVVILVDHNFNPYVDIQAIDRCHRIGQENAVMVYRLVSNEPNEERLMKYFCASILTM